MKYTFDKTLQVLNDLIISCYSFGAVKYETEITPLDGKISFVLKAHIPDLDSETLDKFKTGLKQDRQKEVEEMYWSIDYDSTDPCEPTMIGMMLDDVTVAYADGILMIKASRDN